MASMAKFLVLIAVSFSLLALFGCTSPPSPSPNVTAGNATPPVTVPNVSGNATVAPPAQNVTPPQPPVFKPIHLSYNISTPQGPGGQAQQLMFDYYFTEKTECGNRPALNGFVRMADAAFTDHVSYSKITVYLDSGEAVYSDNTGETDLAFNTAAARVVDFDPAFWPQTIIARGNRSIISGEIWNGTKPVLLENVAAFGANGDYSIMPGSMGAAAGTACKNLTVSVKSSNMNGQIMSCIGRLEDVNLTFVATASIPDMGQGFLWSLKSVTREDTQSAYYSQCLAPVSCPTLSQPTQDDYSQCGMQNKSIDISKDAKGCVTAYECIANDERARRSIASSQPPNCPVDGNLVNQAADCWNRQGSVNYGSDQQTGCVNNVQCGMPPQGGNNQQPQNN